MILLLWWGSLGGHQAAAQAGQVALAEAVDAIFAPWDQPDSPGCAVAVIQDGAIIYQNGYGKANLEHGLPITPETVFYSGSVSKQFVAFSIALLEEQGKLSFDDDIRTYFPELPAYEQPVTVRHMIHHTSGLRDYLQLGALAGRNYLDAMEEAAVIDLLTRQKALNFPPGDDYLYSNSGYFLLAELVKRVSGLSLRVFAEEHLFKPLGMTASHFHDDNTMIVPNRADGYFRKEDDGWGVLTMRFALVGSGGLYTTVGDLFHWDQNFYDNTLGEGTQEVIETTLTRGRLNSGETLTYAFALDVDSHRGLRTIRHGGALGGYRSHLVRFPDQRFSTAILCNLSNIDPGSLADQVAEVYLGDQMEPVEEASAAAAPIARSARELAPALYADYEGQYANERGLIISFVHEDDGFFLDWPGLPRLELFAESETVFFQHFDEDRFSFMRSGEGPAERLMILRGDRELPFTRVPDWSLEALAAYEGSYFNDELDVHYTLSVDEGQLYLRIRSQSPSEVTLFAEDRGRTGLGLLAFDRDQEGHVTGFTLDAGRVMGLSFAKQDATRHGSNR